MREVYPEIYLITENSLLGRFKPPVNIYVICGNNGIIFDAGYGNKSSIRFFINELKKIKLICERRGQDFSISRIIPSHMHPDHFSGLRKLSKILNLKIILTEKMINIASSKENYIDSYEDERLFGDRISRPLIKKCLKLILNYIYIKFYGMDFIKDPDLVIKDRSKISISGKEWEIFPSPGHSFDHISLYNREKGILFAGDNVLRSVTSWLGPPKSDLKEYMASLNYMLGLPKLDLILSSHGSPVVNPKERIKEILSWRQERIKHVQLVVDKYVNAGVSVEGIVAELYTWREFVKRRLSYGWVCLTLDYLEEKGDVKKKSIGGRLRYYPVN